MIYVVTGQPRTGTTMTMLMLEAGGIPAYYDDDQRLLKALRETRHHDGLSSGKAEWLNECHEKCVKILAPWSFKPPPGHDYKFIWMDRDAGEHAKSMRKFSHLVKHEKMNEIQTKATLKRLYKKDRKLGLAYLRSLPQSVLMTIRFETVLKKPRESALRMAEFCELPLDIDKMAAVVIPRRPRMLKHMLEFEK